MVVSRRQWNDVRWSCFDTNVVQPQISRPIVNKNLKKPVRIAPAKVEGKAKYNSPPSVPYLAPVQGD